MVEVVQTSVEKECGRPNKIYVGETSGDKIEPRKMKAAMERS